MGKMTWRSLFYKLISKRIFFETFYLGGLFFKVLEKVSSFLLWNTLCRHSYQHIVSVHVSHKLFTCVMWVSLSPLAKYTACILHHVHPCMACRHSSSSMGFADTIDETRAMCPVSPAPLAKRAWIRVHMGFASTIGETHATHFLARLFRSCSGWSIAFLEAFQKVQLSLYSFEGGRDDDNLNFVPHPLPLPFIWPFCVCRIHTLKKIILLVVVGKASIPVQEFLLFRPSNKLFRWWWWTKASIR